MNGHVDQLAKAAVQKWTGMFSPNQKSFGELEIRRKHLKTLQDVIVNQAANVTPTEFKKVHEEPGEKCFMHKIPPAAICSLFQIGDVPESCPFPPLFLKRVIDWASCLQWPSPSSGEVSALELYIDFTLIRNHLPPSTWVM